MLPQENFEFRSSQIANPEQDCCLIPVTNNNNNTQFQDFWGGKFQPPPYETLNHYVNCWLVLFILQTLSTLELVADLSYAWTLIDT